MTQQRGSTSVLIFDTEATYKTTPAVPDAVIIPFVTESLGLNRELVQSQTRMSGRSNRKPGRGRVDIAGDINFELSPQYGRLLKHIFGSYAVAGGGAPYTHTYKIGDLPVSMAIEKQFADLTKYFLYNGCRINSFKTGAEPSGIIGASVSILGAKETVSGAPFDATATDLGHTPFDGFSASIKLGGSTLATCTKFDFELSNDLDGDMYVVDGTGQRVSLPEGQARVTGSLQALFDSTTLYDLAVAHTETALEFHYTLGAGTGASAGNEKLSFYFDEVVLAPKTPGVNGPKGMLVDLDFVAYLDNDADASACRAVLLTPTATF